MKIRGVYVEGLTIEDGNVINAWVWFASTRNNILRRWVAYGVTTEGGPESAQKIAEAIDVEDHRIFEILFGIEWLPGVSTEEIIFYGQAQRIKITELASSRATTFARLRNMTTENLEVLREASDSMF